MKTKGLIRLSATLFLVIVGGGCTPSATPPAKPSATPSLIGQIGQKSADYMAVTGNETDRFHLVLTRGSLVLNGYLEVTMKAADEKTTVRRIPITGEVSTDGVPSSITIPSSVVGVADLTLGCFFDSSHNLQLVGDNRIRYPHLMYLVK